MMMIVPNSRARKGERREMLASRTDAYLVTVVFPRLDAEVPINKQNSFLSKKATIIN